MKNNSKIKTGIWLNLQKEEKRTEEPSYNDVLFLTDKQSGHFQENINSLANTKIGLNAWHN